MNTILNYYINPHKKLLGEDARMHGCWEQNYIPITLFFEKKIPDFDQLLKRTVEKWFSNNKSPLRARVSKNAQKFYYDNQPSEILIKQFLYKVSTIDDQQIEKLAIDSKLAAILVHTNSAVCLCVNHQFLDGVAAFNILEDLFDNDHKFVIKNFKYVPLITELILLPSIPKYWNLNKRFLTYSPSWQVVGSRAKTFTFQRDLSIFKQSKLLSEKKCNHRVAFASIIAAFQIVAVFKSSRSTYLTVGLLVAFNSAKRFNNYGVISFKIARPSGTFIDFVIKINKILIKKRKMAVATYVAGNVYNTALELGTLDILLSGMPMTLKKKMTINNIRLKNTRQVLNYASCPLYCMYLSCDRYVNFTASVRCPDISMDVFSRNCLQIDPLGQI